MSWRSNLVEAPPPGARASHPLERRRALGGSSMAGLRRVVHCGPAARRAGRPRSRDSILRRRSRLVRPWRSLVRLLSGLALAALVVGTAKADADGGTGPAGGDFTLQSIDGPVNLDDLRGKVVLLFFGYTSCPDICPLSLLRIGDCLSSLEEAQAERVSALFVTLDPGRDTAERMRQYAGFFHPGIVGLTGDAGAIDEVTAQYGITWERKSAPKSALGYSIAHPDTILLVDTDGTLAGEVRGEDGSEALRARVLELLARRG